MNDYKELIGDIGDLLISHPSEHISKWYLQKASDAIEQIVKERDAAIGDIEAMFKAETSDDVCKLCAEYPKHNCFYYSMQKPCNHKWRGVQE